MALNPTERVMCGSWAKNSSTQRRRDVIRPVLVAPSISAGCWCSRPHPSWQPHRRAIRPSTAPVASCRAAPLVTDTATYHRPGAPPSSLLVTCPALTLVRRVSVRPSEDADRQVVVRRGGCDTADERFVSRPTVWLYWTRCAMFVCVLSRRLADRVTIVSLTLLFSPRCSSPAAIFSPRYSLPCSLLSSLHATLLPLLSSLRATLCPARCYLLSTLLFSTLLSSLRATLCPARCYLLSTLPALLPSTGF